MLNSSAEAANKYFDYAKRINKSVEAERFNKSSTEFHQLRRTTGAVHYRYWLFSMYGILSHGWMKLKWHICPQNFRQNYGCLKLCGIQNSIDLLFIISLLRSNGKYACNNMAHSDELNEDEVIVIENANLNPSYRIVWVVWQQASTTQTSDR